MKKHFWAVLAILAYGALTPRARAATYCNFVSQVPAAPNSIQTVRVWMDSNTAIGETAAIEYKIGISYTKVYGNWDDSSYPGANWYADIPAQAVNTRVSYQLFTRNSDNSEGNFTNFNWSYLVTNAASAVNPGDVVINQVQTAGTAAGDEFVELYNRTAAPVDISNWQIGYRLVGGGLGTAGVVIPPGSTIPGNGSFLIATSALIWPARDAAWTTGIAADGQIILSDARGVGIDGLAYGAVTTNLHGEGTPATAIAASQSMRRKVVGGVVQDTNNNSSDFEIVNPSAAKGIRDTGGTLPYFGLLTPGVARRGDTVTLGICIIPVVGNTVSAVKADLTQIGGSATQSFSAPSNPAHICTYNFNLPSNLSLGVKRIVFTITDSAANTYTYNATLDIDLALRAGFARVPVNLLSGGNMRGIAVNNNVASAYYGYVYATDYPNDSVHILAPNPLSDRTAATAYTEVGTITIADATVITVAVGSDDVVWIANLAQVGVETAPPVPPSGNTVASVKRFSLPAGTAPQNIAVTGPITNARVAIASSAGTVGLVYFGGISSLAWDSPEITPTPTPRLTTVSVGGTSYGVAMDSAGNCYAAVSPNGSGFLGATTVVKVDSAGNVVSESVWRAGRPAWANGAMSLADVKVVENPTVPGGGYVIWTGRDVITSLGTSFYRRFTFRYRLDSGEFIDSFGYGGLVGTPTDGTYTGLDLNNTTSPHYAAVDDLGNLYLNSDANANLIKITATQPSVSVGAAVKSSPAFWTDGNVYFGSDDGTLYAVRPSDGRRVAGFVPHNTRTFDGSTTRKVASRASVRQVAGVDRILFNTGDGYLFCLNLDGSLWFRVKLGTGASTMPIVFNNGSTDYVYAAVDTVGGPTLFRRTAMGADAGSVVFVGSTTVKSSPSAYGDSIFVGTDNGAYRVQASTLTVLNTVAASATTGPPFIASTSSAPIAYTCANIGRVYACNATNGSPITAFGGGTGYVDLPITVGSGDKVTAPLFAYNGKVFVGGMDNKVYALSAGTGAGAGPGGSTIFFDAGSAAGPITGGIGVDPNGTGSLVFGSTGGRFFEVSLANPATYRLTDTGGAINTMPTARYGSNDGLFIGNDGGKVFRMPSLQ